jgi:2'-5' RNA ligase
MSAEAIGSRRPVGRTSDNDWEEKWMMRLFVALDIPDHAVAYISNMQRQLRQAIRADRWQPLHNLHLTLHFLGDVDESLLPQLREDMDLVSAIIEPFTLRAGSLGVFPDKARPRVLWLGLNGQTDALKQLHLLLGKRFDLHEGVRYDKRPYRPHITLARGPHADESGLPLHEWNERFLPPEPPQWQVRHVHLYRSVLHPAGAIHTILHTSTFGKDRVK